MIRALIFDVFGTCVDWRGSVARHVAAMLPDVESAQFASDWRARYQPAMGRVRLGERGYIALDDLHLENLALVAQAYGVSIPDPAALNSAWERLDPWPDVVPGLEAMKKQAVIAPCSNGSIAMMTRLARYAGLPWDCILGADIAQDYKPRPTVYLASCAALRLAPEQVMMVAAHNSDLHGARAVGLKTAFVPRPSEHGAGQTSDLQPDADWDVVARDFVDLAVRVGKLVKI